MLTELNHIKENLNEKQHSFIFSDADIIVLFVYKFHRELNF